MLCNKEKFDKKTALTILNKIDREKKKWRNECRYYFCNKCKAFHLTSEESYEERIELKLEELIFTNRWKELSQK